MLHASGADTRTRRSGTRVSRSFVLVPAGQLLQPPPLASPYLPLKQGTQAKTVEGSEYLPAAHFKHFASESLPKTEEWVLAGQGEHSVAPLDEE